MQQDDFDQRPQRRKRRQFSAYADSSRPTRKRYPLDPTYWTGLGYEVEATFPDYLVIRLSPTSTLEDRGDRLTLNCPGEPSDSDIRLMVQAGKDKGWTGIRFSGGSSEFQKRARLEALRQGYSMDQISLECEDGKPKPLASAPMPDHIRRQLQPPADPAPALPAPEQIPTPAQELRI